MQGARGILSEVNKLWPKIDYGGFESLTELSQSAMTPLSYLAYPSPTSIVGHHRPTYHLGSSLNNILHIGLGPSSEIFGFVPPFAVLEAFS